MFAGKPQPKELLRACDPNRQLTELSVCGRYRVVYRLVNTVYVMAVASAAANVFSLMKLVDAMTRVATLASRGVEVTPEKLSRRYPEVCHLLLICCRMMQYFSAGFA